MRSSREATEDMMMMLGEVVENESNRCCDLEIGSIASTKRGTVDSHSLELFGAHSFGHTQSLLYFLLCASGKLSFLGKQIEYVVREKKKPRRPLESGAFEESRWSSNGF